MQGWLRSLGSEAALPCYQGRVGPFHCYGAPQENRWGCSTQLAGSGRSKLSSIADWPAFPERIASMMSGDNNARWRIRLL
jgi:hypothetical protein